jgi:hypothetical protein
MYFRERQQRLAILLTLTSLIIAALACTSNDTLFIQLTVTPTPTITPTPLVLDTKFKTGDTAWAVSTGLNVSMSSHPGTGVDLTAGSQCFRGTKVEVLDKSKDVDKPTSDLILYQVDCGQGRGWLPEYSLSKIDPAGVEAVIKSPDGKGAPLYSQPDAKSKPASATPCADGTKVTTSDVSQNGNVRDLSEDPHLYVQVACGSDSGYVLETMLEVAS